VKGDQIYNMWHRSSFQNNIQSLRHAKIFSFPSLMPLRNFLSSYVLTGKSPIFNKQQLIDELEERRKYHVIDFTHRVQIVQVYSGTKFIVSSLIVKWLVCLFKQVLLLLCVTHVGFIIQLCVLQHPTPQIEAHSCLP
jgi:hypothetical protein